jgi:hypothetical protein
MTSRRPLITIVVINLALVLALWGGHWLLSKKAVSSAAAAEEFRLLQHSSDQSFVLERQLESTQSERLALLAQFVNEDSIVGFLEDVDHWGRQAGAIVKATSVSEDKPITLDLQAIGTFKSVYHFLQLIERAPYQLKITRVIFSHGGETDNISSWKLELTIELLSIDK